MNPLETVRVAWRALGRNKLRSFLTALGIVIGVAAVIAMVAVGEGAKNRVEQNFAAMGSNMLVIMPGSTTAGGAHGGFGSLPTLTWDDLKAIRAEISAVRYLSPGLRTTASLVAEEANWTTSVNGVNLDYFGIRSWAAAQGALFSQGDLDSAAKVVVLGRTVADKLFGAGTDPVGQTVRIKDVPFDVVGVLAAKGQSQMGQDYDDAVFIPYSTYLAKIQGGLKNLVPGAVWVGATSPEGTSRAQRQITELLRDRHRIAPNTDDDFSIRNLTEMANSMQDTTRTIATLLGIVAGVSLFVGGIGIMNIMLVSVTERTREIGIRMAVGARPRDILLQFLVEALALAVAGGAIGVAAGIGIAAWLAATMGWSTLIRTDIVAIAVCFSGLVGVVFGLYPARKASKLDPIQALRFE